jgi:hypothetical protein
MDAEWKLTALELENAELRRYKVAALAELLKFREALEFYASQDNWTVTPSTECNIWPYTTIYNDSTSCDNLTGGKRARAALASAKKEGEGC